MNNQNRLASFQLTDEAATNTAQRELRVYHPDGVLSVIYIKAFESDARAICEAEELARSGYQVEVWRDGTRIDRVSELNNLDTHKHQ